MQIEVTKFRFFVLLITGLILIGVFGVWAATSVLQPGVAPPNGHTINEIAPPSDCDSGQVLTWDGNSHSWECSNQTQGSKEEIAISYTVCRGKVSGLSSCPSDYPNQVYKSPVYFVSADDCGSSRTGYTLTCSK